MTLAYRRNLIIFRYHIMDQAVPETRSRSRSKTPFTLRSSCDGENCNEATHNHEKPKTKKQPTVQ